VVVYLYHLSYAGGRRRIMVQGWSRQKHKTLLKNTYSKKKKKKKRGIKGMTQVVECLPRKPKALSSNLSAKKKKRDMQGLSNKTLRMHRDFNYRHLEYNVI
jgi:cytochrome oxidase assembly protein ShyY1